MNVTNNVALKLILSASIFNGINLLYFVLLAISCTQTGCIVYIVSTYRAICAIDFP